MKLAGIETVNLFQKVLKPSFFRKKKGKNKNKGKKKGGMHLFQVGIFF